MTGGGSAAYDATQSKEAPRGFMPLPFAEVNPYAAECDAFAAAVLDSTPVTANGPDRILHIARLTDASYEAARTGRFIDVAPR